MSNEEEDMEVTPSGGAQSAVDQAGSQTPSSGAQSTLNQAGSPNSATSSLQLHLNLAWSDSDFPDSPVLGKVKNNFERSFQSWLSNNTRSDCKDVQVFENKTAVVTVHPIPDLNVLQKVIKVPLTKDGKSIMIVSGHEITPEMLAQAQAEPLLNTPPLSGSQVVPVQEGKSYCLPVSHFWYLSHVYKKEINRIKTMSGIEIEVDLKVTVKTEEPERKYMACSKFEELCRHEFNGFSIPLNKINPGGWAKAMKIVQKNENKFLLTLSSEELTIFGPECGHEDFRKAFGVIKEDHEEPRSEETPLRTHINSEDPLVDEGLTLEGRYWKLLTKKERVSEIETKFGVKFRESAEQHGKVTIKTSQRHPRNAFAEIHAIRALLRLYQKTATDPTLENGEISGASGYSSVLEGAASGYARNGVSGKSELNAGASSGKGERAAADKEEDKCSICMDAFTNKKQLKCQHEFCEDCLELSKKSLGPICPLCKDVFGRVVGNQPPGTMKYRTQQRRLPGFTCPTIVIDYNIPSGIQTEKHPNPGQPYSGVIRTAYLPDNDEGRDVLKLLNRAFEQNLIFTVGTSRSTGWDNQVTWNDIHHKTNMAGGPQSFGYPDPDYLNRVREELKAQGIQ